MAPKSCTCWAWLVGLLFVSAVSPKKEFDENTLLKSCFSQNRTFVVTENFCDVIIQNISNFNTCVIFLPNSTTVNQRMHENWPQWDNKNRLYISKHLTKLSFRIHVAWGRNCSTVKLNPATDSNCVFNYSDTERCHTRCVRTRSICENTTYSSDQCQDTGVDDRYIIALSNATTNCLKCDNPVKSPAQNMTLNSTLTMTHDGRVDAASAVEVMNKMAHLVSSMNGSSATLSAGGGITGVLLAYKNPVDIEAVSFAYASPNASISIISSSGKASDFSRSVSVCKEAFNQALGLNNTRTFAALMRFSRMAGDALNSTVLNDEVLAVEMGTHITNLTEKINITFRGLTYDWIPSCHSWNGEGRQPNWTQDGCETIMSGPNITCRCSHLTFFAILMSAPNETISSSDLRNLTIITQVGCGVSIMFLSTVLFMHFLMRKAKTNKSSVILMHLVLAMLLLDLTFLVNSPVANLKDSVGCTVMGAAMHYFMLATFTWFAAQAFHLCLQLYMGGKIVIRHYVLKMSIGSWVLPSIFVIVLLIVGKYGEEVVSTDSTTNNAAMCWITDVNVHYFVNMGYYAFVFLFTFTTFIIVLSWLVCLKRHKGGAQVSSNGTKRMMSVMGLCCMLGLTWGFAFFTYGVLRVPACYIFTVLNSFQGFFLFLYYYNTRKRATTNTDTSNKASTSSTATLQTSLDVLMNPYMNTGNFK